MWSKLGSQTTVLISRQLVSKFDPSSSSMTLVLSPKISLDFMSLAMSLSFYVTKTTYFGAFTCSMS